MDGKIVHILLFIAACLMFVNGAPKNEAVSVPPNFETCFKELKIADKTVQQKILTDPQYQFPDQQCFSKCILLAADVINKKGIVNPDAAKRLAASMKTTISDAQIAKCQEHASKNGKNECEVADLGTGCILQAIGQI
ncbi:unnamed protein product [Diamesa serratosioi]